MKTINRQAVLVRAKQPFVDWINEVERSMDSPTRFDLEQVNDDSHVYLIQEIDMMEDTYEYFASFKEEIFETEVASWFTDPSLWPHRLTSEVFDEWFEVTHHSVLIDLERGRLKRSGRWP